MKQSNIKLSAISAIAAAAIFSVATPAVNAAVTAPTPFNVTVTLSSVCTVAAIPDLSFGTYTAFGAATIPNPTTSVGVTCTRGLAATPTLAFDATNGVVAGLNYSVAAGAAALTAGTAATPGVPGTADTYAFTVTGTMVAGQPGTNSVGLQTDIRTVTITY